ncbi:MAG TPA: rhodanese-like domain-containing protein [Desulfobacteria bacterium]|nr:rhodanese-like domain-containing protein [Desulfobacteria bacterium]
MGLNNDSAATGQRVPVKTWVYLRYFFTVHWGKREQVCDYDVNLKEAKQVFFSREKNSFGRDWADINQSELYDLLKTKQDLKVVDVRTPEEFKRGHISQALLRPLSELEMWAGEFKPSEPLILVCASGGRSEVAARSLAQKGYSSLYSLKGGMSRWNGLVDRSPLR